MMLNKLQEKFWNCMRSTNPLTHEIDLVSKSGCIAPSKRLDIYRSTIRTAHTNALAQTYPCCENILGTKYFNQIAKQYFYKFAAKNQNLNFYGDNFSEFLQQLIEQHDELFDYPYLPDLAKLEFAFERAYYAKDNPKFDFGFLANLDDSQQLLACFNLSPCIFLMESEYPVYEIWQANQNSDANHTESIAAIENKQFICVSREHFKPTITTISEQYFWLMQQFKKHLCFSEIFLLIENEEFDIPIQTIIPDLTRMQWVSCCYLKESTASNV